MKVKIKIGFDTKELVPFAESDFPHFRALGDPVFCMEPERLIQSVKGAVLCTLGCWRNPPDSVEFEVPPP